MKRPDKMDFAKYRELLKNKAEDLKRRLLGKVMPGTESSIKPKGRIHPYKTKGENTVRHTSHLRKYRARRNRLNKISAESRRKNR